MVGQFLAALVVFAGTTVNWVPFHSHTYPYTVTQPSSYRHAVLENTLKRNVDYFFPSLGSYVTSVSIYSDGTYTDLSSSLRGAGGRNIHRSTWITIMGKKLPLICANFSGIPGRWTLEQTVFRARGRVWHLTASYAARYKNQRPLMLRMLRSFKAR